MSDNSKRVITKEAEGFPHMAEDKAWFAEHPDRSYRIRPFREDELSEDNKRHLSRLPAGWRRFTVVRQLAPGLRVRAFVNLGGKPAQGEHAASCLYAQCRTPA